MMALATASTYLWKERGMVVGSAEAGIDRELVGMDGMRIETGYVSEDMVGDITEGTVRFLWLA
jgi:hypothetical protein